MIHSKIFQKIINNTNYRQTRIKIFKNSKLIIIQSPFQAKMNLKNKDNIYADSTFYAIPKLSYLLFIKRIYAK